jgi:hypothetical protein
MKLEIYVVTTEISLKCERDALELLKIRLCEQFGGLTESATAKGYWLDNGKLVTDVVTVWTILSATVITESSIRNVIEAIKRICRQKSQLITINDKPYFV